MVFFTRSKVQKRYKISRSVIFQKRRNSDKKKVVEEINIRGIGFVEEIMLKDFWEKMSAFLFKVLNNIQVNK